MKNTKAEIVSVIKLWLALRVITSLLAMFFSISRPWNDFERQVRVWPPAGEIGIFLYRILISPWMRWDTEWFEKIVARGYVAGDGTTNFYPLFMWVSALFHQIGLNPAVSLMLVGSLTSLALFLAYYFLARLDLEQEEAFTALLLFAVFPVAFILFAPYTESMFLLWVVLAFYCLRKEQWYLAALFVFLATLTRQQGLFLILPITWVFHGKSWDELKKMIWQVVLTLLAAPIALVTWTLYRIVYLREGGVDLTSAQSLIYSVFLSPSSNQVVPKQGFILPWSALRLSMVKVITAVDLDILVDLFLALVFVMLLIVAWSRLQAYDRVYALTITLVSLSYHTGTYHPYMGLPRHMLIAPAVFMGLAAKIHKFPLGKLAVIVSQIVGMIFMIAIYVWHAWVP